MAESPRLRGCPTPASPSVSPKGCPPRWLPPLLPPPPSRCRGRRGMRWRQARMGHSHMHEWSKATRHAPRYLFYKYFLNYQSFLISTFCAWLRRVRGSESRERKGGERVTGGPRKAPGRGDTGDGAGGAGGGGRRWQSEEGGGQAWAGQRWPSVATRGGVEGQDGSQLLRSPEPRGILGCRPRGVRRRCPHGSVATVHV